MALHKNGTRQPRVKQASDALIQLRNIQRKKGSANLYKNVIARLEFAGSTALYYVVEA